MAMKKRVKGHGGKGGEGDNRCDQNRLVVYCLVTNCLHFIIGSDEPSEPLLKAFGSRRLSWWMMAT